MQLVVMIENMKKNACLIFRFFFFLNLVTAAL